MVQVLTPRLVIGMQIKNNGFTLIEVLVALMVLAIAFTAAVLSTQNSIRNTIHIKQNLSAHWVGMNVMSEMQVGVLAPPTESQKAHGEAQQLGKIFEWTAGIDQKGKGYKRIYINIKEKGKTVRLEHLVGFIHVQAR